MSDIKEMKKISQLKIEYKNNDDTISYEDALIYLPPSQVEGLEQSIYWTFYTSESTQEEDIKQ